MVFSTDTKQVHGFFLNEAVHSCAAVRYSARIVQVREDGTACIRIRAESSRWSSMRYCSILVVCAPETSQTVKFAPAHSDRAPLMLTAVDGVPLRGQLWLSEVPCRQMRSHAARHQNGHACTWSTCPARPGSQRKDVPENGKMNPCSTQSV